MDNTFQLPDECKEILLSEFQESCKQNIFTILQNHGCNTVGELFALDGESFSRWPGVGDGKVRLIEEFQNVVRAQIENSWKSRVNPYSSATEEELINKRWHYELKDKMNVQEARDYSLLRDEMKNRAISPFPEKMSEIPLSTCREHELIDVRTMNTLTSLGKSMLTDVFDVTRNDVLRTRNAGKQVWLNIIAFKKKIHDSPEYILDIYETYGRETELPTSLEGSIASCIDGCITEIVERLRIQNLQKDAELIELLFLKGEGTKEVAIQRPETEQTVRNHRDSFLYNFMSGPNSTIGYNIHISQKFIDKINETGEKICNKYLEDAIEICEAKDVDQMKRHLAFYNLQILRSSNDSNHIDKDLLVSEKYKLKQVGNATREIYKYLSGMPRFVSVNELIGVLGECAGYKPWWNEFAEQYVHNICPRVTWEDGKLGYSIEFLKSAEVRTARIIYMKRNEGDSVSLAQLSEMEPSGKNSASKAAKMFNWISSPKPGLYKYVEDQTEPNNFMSDIKKYAEDHEEFSCKEMIKYFQKNSRYTQHKDSSFRTAALKVCRVNNDNPDILRLTSTIDDNDSRWRSKTQSGITNWTIQAMVKILQDKKGKVKRNKLLKLVAEQKDAEQFQNFDKAIYVILSKYSCTEDDKNELFIRKLNGSEEEEILLNEEVLKDVDLKTIGRVDKKPSYYMEVITAIVNKLKESNESDYTLPLKDLRKFVIDERIIPQDISGTVFYKIINSILPQEIEKVDIDGEKYLRYILQNRVVEEFSIQSQDIESNVEEPKVVKVQTDRPLTNYLQRPAINKDELTRAMCAELAYFKRFWDIECDFDDSIYKFINYVSSLPNHNISDILLRSLYEFFCYKNDRYDLYHQLTDFVLSYEAFIREIYTSNTGIIAEGTNGLMDSVRLIPALDNWAPQYYNQTTEQGFPRMFVNLRNRRNRRGHCDDSDLSAVQIMQASTNAIALYVYTFARFIR